MAVLGIITTGWKSEQTDCSNCYACDDIIVSEMWRLWMYTDVKKKKNDRPLQYVICNSCKSLMDKDE